MAEITINGRIKVQSFYNAFLKEFPYLFPALKYPDGKPVDPDTTIANARSKSKDGAYSPTGEAGMSVNGNLFIETFEKRFTEQFSITCNIHLKKNGKWVATGPKYNSLSLSKASQMAENEGFDIIKI
jgi:hypothetical protein